MSALPKKVPAKKSPAKAAATAKPKAPAKNAKPAPSGKPQALSVVLASLDDNKAQNVVPIDIMGRSSIADWMVIASGTSARHVASMAGHLMEKLKAIGIRPREEGLPQADWVAVDGGDVVIHLFRPEVRSFYDLEGMWKLPDSKPKGKTAAKSPSVAADKPAAKKAPATKKAPPVKKPAAKVRATKKPVASKKAVPVKKPAAKAPAAKKPVASKKATPVKKPVGKKPVGKKPAPKKKA
ncbi:MAG: ribosome silencing factor [Alphaproteobacteria bacterium]|nr:ribosome silencing factor [Alphaproteobacteria bacterium]